MASNSSLIFSINDLKFELLMRDGSLITIINDKFVFGSKFYNITGGNIQGLASFLETFKSIPSLELNLQVSNNPMIIPTDDNVLKNLIKQLMKSSKKIDFLENSKYHYNKIINTFRNPRESKTRGIYRRKLEDVKIQKEKETKNLNLYKNLLDSINFGIETNEIMLTMKISSNFYIGNLEESIDKVLLELKDLNLIVKNRAYANFGIKLEDIKKFTVIKSLLSNLPSPSLFSYFPELKELANKLSKYQISTSNEAIEQLVNSMFRHTNRPEENNFPKPDFTTIPGKRNGIYMGFIYGTKKLAFLNMNDLKEGVLILGKQRIGKSILSHIIAEGLYFKNIPTLFIDPSNTATGFIKRNKESKNLKKFYLDKININFESNIFLDTNIDINELIQLKIHILALNEHIINKDYERLNKNIIEILENLISYFSELKDTDKLRYLIVIDELHLLNNEVMKEIDKCLRLFPKKGVSLILISHNLTDFQRLRALTGIRFVFNVSYTPALEMLSKGTEFSKYINFLPRLPKRIVMIQSNNYNNGLPYFIEVRSPLHEPKGLSLREIKKIINHKEDNYENVKNLFNSNNSNDLEQKFTSIIKNYKEIKNILPFKDEIRKELGVGWMKFNELIEKLENQGLIKIIQDGNKRRIDLVNRNY